MKKYLSSLILILFILLAALPVWAAEPASPNLTLNDAVTKALANSKSVKNAAVEVDSTRILRDQKAEDVGFILTEPSGNLSIDAAFANLLTTDLTWQMSYKTLTVQQDSVALGACKKYWDVQQSLVALDAARTSLKQADQDILKARVSQRVGLISNADLIAAEAKYASAKGSLDKAQNDLETAYTALNQAIGLASGDRPVLVEELTFTPLDKDVNLDVAVNHTLQKSPSIWLANEKVNIQKYAKESIYFTGSYTQYEVRNNNVTQAVNDYASTKEAAETLTRNLYYSVRTLEENYPAAEQAVKLAEENLRVGQVKYQVGMATRADVAALETALAQARQSLLQIKANHAYYKLAFDKPWAYGGS